MSSLPLPQDTDLPFFAYGRLRPGAPGYTRVKAFMSNTPIPATAAGSLKIRDGLPLYVPGPGHGVRGHFLQFEPNMVKRAYEEICRFEPKAQYKWEAVRLEAPSGSVANVLAGKSPDRGSLDYEGDSWAMTDDPVLTEGLNVIRKVADESSIDVPFQSQPHGVDWNRLFRLQMAYQLLWSIIERYVDLNDGPIKDPMVKLRSLEADERFVGSLARQAPDEVSQLPQTLYDSRNPENAATFTLEKPKACLDYYYLVRSNLTHRGKGTWQDAEIVRISLLHLLRVMEAIDLHYETDE